ncbi:MAG: DUF192 domain-containing protein [Gammaproteobacteria bacterium]|nr:DUF192 domain-containing protein [Gammaproteobacteria bacterium]
MKHGQIFRENDQKLILEEVMLTTSPLERMRGLLGRPGLAENQGLLIKPCSSVHTFGMGYPIDLIFIDRDWCIRKLVSHLGSCRMAWCRNAHMVLETCAHNIARWDLETGNVLRWEEN